MNPWNIIVSIAKSILWLLDVSFEVSRWRRHLRAWGTAILAVIAAGLIEAAPLKWIIAGAMVIAGLVSGVLWNRRR